MSKEKELKDQKGQKQGQQKQPVLTKQEQKIRDQYESYENPFKVLAGLIMLTSRGTRRHGIQVTVIENQMKTPIEIQITTSEQKKFSINVDELEPDHRHFFSGDPTDVIMNILNTFTAIIKISISDLDANIYEAVEVSPINVDKNTRSYLRQDILNIIGTYGNKYWPRAATSTQTLLIALNTLLGPWDFTTIETNYISNVSGLESSAYFSYGNTYKVDSKPITIADDDVIDYGFGRTSEGLARAGEKCPLNAKTIESQNSIAKQIPNIFYVSIMNGENSVVLYDVQLDGPRGEGVYFYDRKLYETYWQKTYRETKDNIVCKNESDILSTTDTKDLKEKIVFRFPDNTTECYDQTNLFDYYLSAGGQGAIWNYGQCKFQKRDWVSADGKRIQIDAVVHPAADCQRFYKLTRESGSTAYLPFVSIVRLLQAPYIKKWRVVPYGKVYMGANQHTESEFISPNEPVYRLIPDF